MLQASAEVMPDLYEKIGDTLWHPVQSPLRLHNGEPTTFWISEYPERFGEYRSLHNFAQAYRVDFVPEMYTREGAEAAAIGKTALITMPHLLYLMTLQERAYVRLKPELPAAVERTYDTLLKHAAFVAGMPFETPLRWQKVHGMNMVGGIGGEVARYIMGDFGDGRTFTLYSEKGENFAYIGPWKLESSIPLNDGTNNFRSTEITRTTTKPSVNIHTTTPNGTSLDYQQGGAEDVIQFMKLMDEAVRDLPQKQADFITTLRS